jgi:site-specific recombinase XerD
MKDFIQYLQSKNLSEASQQMYLREIKLFLQWYKKNLLSFGEACTGKDILKYLEYLQNDKQHNIKSCSLSLLGINHYFSFLASPIGGGLAGASPTAFIKLRGTHKKTLYHIYTAEELQTIYDNYYSVFIQNFDDSHIAENIRLPSFLGRQRNYVMLGFTIYQGIAAGDLYKIKLPDIDINKASLHIAGRKRSNARNVPLNASQIGSLMHYIQDIRPQFIRHANIENDKLFLPFYKDVSTKNEGIKMSGIIYTLTQQLKQLDKHFINFKQIRASVITQWLKTQGLRKAQYLAGHRYISSTEHYQSNNLEGLIEDITKYNPF